MGAGRDIDLLLWAVAEARRLRNEEPASFDSETSAFGMDTVLPGAQFATDWQQPVGANSY